MSTDYASNEELEEDPDSDDEDIEDFESNDEDENQEAKDEDAPVVKKKKRNKYKWEYNPFKNEEIYLNTHSKSKKGKYMGCDEDGTIQAIEFREDTPLEQSPLAAFQSISVRNDGKYIALRSREYGYYLSFDQYGNAIGVTSQCYFEINQESSNKYSFRAVDSNLWLYYDEKNWSFKGKKGRGLLSSPIKFYLSNAFIDKSIDSWNYSINTSDVLQFKSNGNIVTCTTPYIKGKGEWKNVFGNHIISQGHNKRWTIKIIPNYDPEKRKTLLEKAIGQDGLITRGIEYIPVGGYVVAAGHLMAGNSDRAKRAAKKCNKTTGKVAKRGVKLAVRTGMGAVTGGGSEAFFMAADAVDFLMEVADFAGDVMDVAGDVIDAVQDVKEQYDEVADNINEIKDNAKEQYNEIKEQYDELKEELGVEEEDEDDDDDDDDDDDSDDDDSDDDDEDWEYKPRKIAMIILQTNKRQKYIGCDADGTIKCLNLKGDVKAGFLSLPRKGGYVALRSIKNRYYLSVNGKGIVKGSKRPCWFKVKAESGDKYSFQSENGGQFLYFDSNNMMMRGETKKGASEVKFFVWNAAESGGIMGFLMEKVKDAAGDAIGDAIDGVKDTAKDATGDLMNDIMGDDDDDDEDEDDEDDEDDDDDDDEDEKKDEMGKGKTYRANIYIGIANIKQLDTENGGFWLNKMGYCIFGKTGKRVHGNKKKSYAHKFYIEDKISVEVNMDKFEMGFYVNGEYKGRAFKIEPEESYCLALAIKNSDYDIKIVENKDNDDKDDDEEDEYEEEEDEYEEEEEEEDF